MLLYFIWMYYDWDTCNQGGRSYKRIKIVRGNGFWRCACDYFPIKLLKTVDLSPTKSYMYICIAHGIYSLGIMVALLPETSYFNELFASLEIRATVLDQLVTISFFRQWLYINGCCAVNARSINYLLSSPPNSPFTGRATAIIVGGAAEALESRPGIYRILLKKRKSFVRIALQNG